MPVRPTPPKPKLKPKPEPQKVDNGYTLDQSATDKLVQQVRECCSHYEDIYGRIVKPPIVDVEIRDTLTETYDGKLFWTDKDKTRQLDVTVRFRIEPEPKKEV